MSLEFKTDETEFQGKKNELHDSTNPYRVNGTSILLSTLSRKQLIKINVLQRLLYLLLMICSEIKSNLFGNINHSGD